MILSSLSRLFLFSILCCTFINTAECQIPAAAKAPAAKSITIRSISVEAVTVEATAADKDLATKAASDRAEAEYFHHFPEYRKVRKPFRMNAVDTVNKDGTFTCRVTLRPA